ncbi:MAG: YbhB/YbcL family Raf kinase inhibitor-like protein [Gemmatimonadaceae bacterium]
MPFRISSPAFPHEGVIPPRFTCDGDDTSPALSWEGAPEGTRSFALLVVDPDAPDSAAPKMTYVHWVLYDMPPGTSGLPEGVDASTLPPGTREGRNDWHRTGWGGPCPPIGRHRYYFQLFALDALLGDLKEPTRALLERAMAPHLLARAELMGTYSHEDRPARG